MFSKRKFKQMRPPPPSTLSKEYSRVWIGWCMIGDREVAREAAAKGIYIQLALQFIATRKEWDHSDVERWFKSEILSWVYQLVEQKQIFKASHILLNIGTEPTEQLSIFLSETNNKSMRDYIAEHLQKNGILEASLLNSWRFILAIEKSNNILFNNIWDDISQISIQKIEQKSNEWKSNVAAALFFNSFDFHLESFLTSEAAWDNLLYHEKFDILKLWINIYFSKDLQYDCKTTLTPEIYQKLKNIFLVWQITNCMINQIKFRTYQETVKDFVLNELSNFGVFTDDEKHNVPKILSRLSKTQNIQNIFNILDEPSSYLNMSEFYEKLNNFCVTHELYEVLSVCSSECNISSLVKSSNSKQLSLWLRKKDSKDSTVTEEVLNKHIVTALNYFADNETSLYLQNNPIILIAIIIFTKDTNFYDIIVNKADITFDNLTITAETVINYLSKLPVFSNILTKFISKIPEDHNLYELLRNHSNLINAFEFRNKFIEMPHFTNKTLCEQFGHAENINYVYYIKQHRPSKAAKLFLLEQFRKHGKLQETEMDNVSQKIFKLILNCSSSEIKSSCVAFLEMIGISTHDLRTIISSMDLVKSSELFINIETNSQIILNTLENLLLSKYNIKENNFINIIKGFELVLNFAKINHLDFPEKFLLHCAENNLWLQFVIFIQIYNYPIDQSLKLIMHFKNKEIMEHVYHALSTEIEPDLDRSFSSSLLSTSITSCDSEPCATENLSEQSNLLKVLIKCHKSEDPPTILLHACQIYKNPLFAILATCYEPDSVVINWLTWLSISTNIDIDVVENYSISPNAVSQLLENVLLKKHVRTLLESFEIFLPENPLHSFVQFLYNCVLLNFNSCSEHLKQFEKCINSLNYNTALINNDFEYTFLTNSYWLINIALKLIFATLGNCFQSKQNQIKFLNFLCRAEFAKNVPIEYPNFCAISKLLESLSSDVTINLSVFLDLDKRREEIVKSIEELVNKKQYNDALELAKYENICKEYVLNEEWSTKFKHQLTCDFFVDCEEAFINANILPSSGAEFYVYCCINISDNSDKYRTLKLAYSWLKKSNYSDHFVENIEQEIWSNYFALDDVTLKGSYYEKHETNYLLSEIKQRTNTKSKFDHELNKDQLRHFEETIGKLLESGDIIETLRLEKMFNQKCPETAILLTCYELAEGKLKPYEISAEQRLLFLNRDMNLKSVPHRRRAMKSTRTTSSGSYDSIKTVSQAATTDHEESNPQDILTLLETMTDRLKHGSNIGSRILMCYRISINVNKSYKDIVKHSDSMTLLKTALENDCCNKLEVVHDVLIIYKWGKSEVTDFIYEELKKAIRVSINLNLDSVYMWDIDLDSQFHLVLQLCPDTNSILGKKLLTATSAIQKTQIINSKDFDMKEICIIVELLVRAHDCYNAYCNMEGIAAVLRKAQTVTSVLLNLKQWKLMVRLLTGIGRYSEMNYIFQILKENDQFEYLLKRNFRQNNGLKVALFKFLKKHCPKNQDLYRIVALHFTLFSEVAELWENEANEMINNLIEIAKLEVQNQGRNIAMEIILFSNNESTKMCLNKAMMNFTHAAEYHLHGDKLICAMRTAKQAELIALQISLLKSLAVNANTKCILKLSSKQILEMISTELSFPQSKILVESYNYQADWGAVVFQQCVLNAKSEYLEEYLISKPLTNTLAQDLTRRFLAQKNVPPISVKAMKEILKRLGSVHMRYRLASELGFGDVIETLLNGSQLAYLKDTVWKKGYKQL